jgi:hypothetical protein
MSADTIATRNITRTVRVLAAVVALGSVAWLYIVAWGSFGFARHVIGLPLSWSLAYVVALDLCSFAVVITTAVMRNVDGRTRWRLWGTMAFFMALQVGSFEGFATWRGLSVTVRVWSLAPAIALALVIELLITHLRYADRQRAVDAAERGRVARLEREAARDAAELAAYRVAYAYRGRQLDYARGEVAELVERAAAVARMHAAEIDDMQRAIDNAIGSREAVVAHAVAEALRTATGHDATGRRTEPPQRRPRPAAAGGGARPGRQPHPGRDQAVARVLAGEASTGDIAAELDVTERAVQRWLQNARTTSNGHAPDAPIPAPA